MSCVAMIPARGGSKRLPRKNIMEFRGRPMMSYTIEAAKESGCFGRIVVSTEDEEIAKVGDEYGAEIIARSPALATDEARVLDVCDDFIRRQSDYFPQYDVLCVLYATSPLRTADDIRAVVEFVRSGDHSSALAVTTYSLPVHQALSVKEDRVEPVFPDLISKRRNEVPEYYVDNGSTYAVSLEYFRHTKQLISPDLAVHVMPRARSVDIDTLEDYLIAQCFAEHLQA